MALQFNKINVSINGANILAESASLSQQSTQKPLYGISFAGPVDYAPGTIKSSLNITYTIEVANEPNYNIISNLKAASITNNTQAIINLGNIIFTGYLSKFSYIVAPVQTIKAQATYDIFTQITGNIFQSNVTDGNLYNITNSSGVSNYFSAFLYSGNIQNLNSSILQMDYTFSCTPTPIYTLGNPFPVQVYIPEATEVLNTISEVQNNNQFSGQNLYNIFGVDSIRLTNVSSTWGDNSGQLIYYISGMKNNSSKIDITTTNIILFNNQFSQSF